jgi:uncharacterized repeat protein (TIGR01451 family)
VKIFKLLLNICLILTISNVMKAHAAAAFVNSWVTDYNINSTSDFTLAASITPTSGNLLLLFVTTKQDLATSPTITGWTNRGIKCTSSSTACIYAFSKLATGSETVSVLLDNRDKPNSAVLSILEYSGALNTLHSSAVSNGTGTSLLTNTITTSYNNELLIAVSAVDSNVSHGTWTNSFIQRIDRTISGAGKIRLDTSVVDRTTNTVGTFSTGTILSSSHSWATMIFNFDSVESNTSDLVLTKTVSNTHPSVFQNFTYSLSVYNSGPNDNANVQVTDTMPSFFTLVSTTPSSGTTYNLATGIWDIGSLPVGATKTLTIVEYANADTAGQTITNTAQITSYTRTDPNTSNNIATTTMQIKSISSAPVLNSPIVAGDTTVSGVSSGGDGTTISVYNEDTLIGNAVVTANVWTANVVTVSGGDSIRAKATFPGGSESDFSPAVIVLFKTTTPLITVPVYAGSTSISGTTSEANGTSIEVFLDNVLLGTTTANGGTWTLTVSKPTLISTHLLKVRATAPGKYVSAFSANVTIIDAISPVPAISTPIIAGLTVIEGTSIGPDSTLIEIFKTRSGTTTSIGFAVVSSNNWVISGLDDLEIRSGDIITAKARIDTNNDGVNNSSDTYSTSSTGVTAQNRTSQVPSINCANSGETEVSGCSTGNDTTLIKLYKNNSLFSSVPVSNFLWSVATPSLTFGDEYKATATFDNNNDGVIDGSDSASGYSSVMIVGGTPPTNAPHVSQPVTAGDTTITGTSDEDNGTTIEVFINGSSVGTTSVSELSWEIAVPANALQTGEVVTAKATASGKTQSASSAGITAINQIPPTPSVNFLKAGGTTISGSVIAPNGSIIEVLVNTVQVGSTTVSSNSWTLTVPSNTLQTGESVRARTHIDYNNDGTIELDDESSSLSTEVIVINRISPIPVLDPIGFNSGSITGSLSPVAVTKIFVYRLRGVTRTLLGVTQTNSPTFFLDEIISNPWILGDSITATSITDTNNDGVVDDNDVQSEDSAAEIIFDDSIFVTDSDSANSFCRKDTPSGSPLIYNIESFGKNGLKVFFNPNIQPKDKFEYQYINQQSTFERKGQIKDYNSGFFILENLVSFAPHKVRIRAINGCKAGSWSEYKNATPGITLSTSVPTASNTNEMFPKPFIKDSFKETYTDKNLEIGKNEINETLPKTELKKEEGSSNVIYFITGILLVGSAGIIFYFKKIQK